MSGLVPLGDPDAIACEGDACVIPDGRADFGAATSPRQDRSAENAS